ncbi:hypothetical protein TNCV_227271 [Trichonephila clavipes]|nr:hypothetical protein TNCV_227271 [Trichonephila clavipes]
MKAPLGENGFNPVTIATRVRLGGESCDKESNRERKGLYLRIAELCGSHDVVPRQPDVVGRLQADDLGLKQLRIDVQHDTCGKNQVLKQPLIFTGCGHPR